MMRRLLARRSVHTTEEARRYLGSPGELTDARLMPNLDVAVERLATACREGETVALFGDFDVDGVTSTTILTEGLRECHNSLTDIMRIRCLRFLPCPYGILLNLCI